MAKDRVCNGCSYNNNGWCTMRKTNKDLKDLIECEYKIDDKLLKLEEYKEQKKFELSIEDNAFNRGFVKGIEAALKIMNKK